MDSKLKNFINVANDNSALFEEILKEFIKNKENIKENELLETLKDHVIEIKKKIEFYISHNELTDIDENIVENLFDLHNTINNSLYKYANYVNQLQATINSLSKEDVSNISIPNNNMHISYSTLPSVDIQHPPEQDLFQQVSDDDISNNLINFEELIESPDIRHTSPQNIPLFNPPRDTNVCSTDLINFTEHITIPNQFQVIPENTSSEYHSLLDNQNQDLLDIDLSSNTIE
jgi:hypothetical protein